MVSASSSYPITVQDHMHTHTHIPHMHTHTHTTHAHTHIPHMHTYVHTHTRAHTHTHVHSGVIHRQCGGAKSWGHADPVHRFWKQGHWLFHHGHYLSPNPCHQVPLPSGSRDSEGSGRRGDKLRRNR